MATSFSLEKALAPVRRAVSWAVVGVFAVIVLVVAAQVAARFVFNAPLSWSEELARYLQVWLILLASASCLRKGMHLTVDYAVHALPPRPRAWLRLFVLVGLGFFLTVVVVSAVSLIVAAGNQSTPALGLPTRAVYLALPVGALLMLAETVASAKPIVSSAIRRHESDDPEEAPP